VGARARECNLCDTVMTSGSDAGLRRHATRVPGKLVALTRSPFTTRTFLVAALLALTSAYAAVVHAKPFDLSGSDWEGCADFAQIARDELGNARVVVVANRLDMRELKREDAVVLLHPERALDPESLASFMRHGGRVVLLDDYGTGDRLLSHFGIQRVPAPQRPVETLRGNPQLAIAEPASNHPVVHDVGRVVTNHPTGVRHPDLSPVLKMRGVGEPDVLLAEAGAVGMGRFLAIGDASIVINSMLRYPGNKALARAIVRYATDDDTWGKRSGRIFIAAGDFEQRGSFGEQSALSDDLEEIRRGALDALDHLRREGMPATLAYWSAVLVALGIVLWVGARAGKTHRAAAPRFVRTIPTVLHGGVAGHAAVIGAPSTSRVLALLELKSALEEDLSGLLEQAHVAGAASGASPGRTAVGTAEASEVMGHERLLDAVGRAGLLDARGLRALKEVLLRLSKVETMALTRGGAGTHSAAGGAWAARIRDREVLHTAAVVEGILSLAHVRARSGGVPIVAPPAPAPRDADIPS
jgi:hypothetical protein